MESSSILCYKFYTLYKLVFGSACNSNVSSGVCLMSIIAFVLQVGILSRNYSAMSRILPWSQLNIEQIGAL
jgi:hypothetical protein